MALIYRFTKEPHRHPRQGISSSSSSGDRCGTVLWVSQGVRRRDAASALPRLPAAFGGILGQAASQQL